MESLAYLHTALLYESTEPTPELRDLSELLPSPTQAAWLSAQVLAAALVVGAAGSAMAATGTVQTNGNPLNVRSTPGGPVVSSLPNGARVELTGRRSGNYLELANGTGFRQTGFRWATLAQPSPWGHRPNSGLCEHWGRATERPQCARWGDRGHLAQRYTSRTDGSFQQRLSGAHQ
jgi:hypothetical protein